MVGAEPRRDRPPVKLLVLGPTGQLGGDVLRAARGRTGIAAAAAGRATVDLADLDAIEAALADAEADVVLNCAAYTAVDAAESDAVNAFTINGYAVERLARACARADRLLVTISTDYVFDGEADRPYAPGDPPAPINVYGASKLAGEALARRAHPDGTLVVRTSSVFGGVGRARGNFVETMLKIGLERDRVTVVDDIVMAPTFSADLAEWILDLLEGDPDPGVYHMTNAGRATWFEFARAVFGEAGRDTVVDPVPAAEYPMAARRPRFSVLDTSSSTGWVGDLPPWEDALRRYLALREGT
jgi:dTDP-4-dehydrorhamnose reductase